MPLNIAMLGTGRIADGQLAPAINAANGVRLWSVLSRDSERAKKFAIDHNAAAPEPAHSDLDALLADDALDAVLIATPDKLHLQQALAAARAGKHVFTEKPMATESEDARTMVDACAKAGVKLGVAYHMRWHAGHRSLAKAAHDGQFGTLRHMRVQWTFLAADASNWRARPDVGRWWGLAGVGTHCLDQIRWFMTPSCGDVTRLESLIGRSVWGSPHDETAMLSMELASGSTAELTTSVVYDGPKRMEVYGTEGWAMCEDTLGPHGAGRIWTDKGPWEYQSVNPYIGEIEDFVAAVENDRAPEVDGEEGARNVELLVQAVS